MAGTGRRSHLKRLVFAFVVLGGFTAACVPASPPPPSVIFYGDSVTSETQSYINLALSQTRPSWKRYFRSYGGAAICDYFDEMRADGNLNAKVVVIQFSGNPLSPCMGGVVPETLNWYMKYQGDASYAASLWKSRGVRVLFIGNLRDVCQQPPHPLDWVYQDVATRYGMTFSAAPALALTAASSSPCTPAPTRVFAFWMPCLAFEDAAHGCVGGLISVRNGTATAPGSHFDPHGTYSAGAFRFGTGVGAEAAKLMV